MRIHVTANGKATSISMDENLIDYLGAHMVRNSPKLHTDAKAQLERAKSGIQDLVRSSKNLPDKDLSQYVQGVILKNIVNPEFEKILESRGPRYVPPKRLADSASKLPPLTPAQLAIAAERKQNKALLKEAKKQRRDRESLKLAMKNSAS